MTGPSKEFFVSIDNNIEHMMDEPEKVYRIALHPIRGEVYETTGITTILFKAKCMVELWLKMYRYIAKHDRNIADTVFYNKKIFEKNLKQVIEDKQDEADEQFNVAVTDYIDCCLDSYMDDIWVVEMKYE